MRVVIAILACAAACNSDDGRCDPPDELTYNCEPMPLGTPDTCQGGPAFDGMPQADTDKAFPVNCEASYPFCVEAYPASVQTCYCSTDGMTFQWFCQI
jgi:hypothetical protein